MAILFKGDKINTALIEYGETLKDHDAKLLEIQACLGTKANFDEVSNSFEKTVAISECLEGAVKKLDFQLRDLLERAGRIEERTGRLEDRDGELADLIDTKASTINVKKQGESLAACHRALTEFRDDRIPSQMAHKVDVIVFDKQRVHVEALAQQIDTLTEATAQIAGVCGQKAETSELQEHREALDSSIRVAETHRQDLIVALASKAQATQHSQLEECVERLRRQLADMEADFRMDIDEVGTVLASKADAESTKIEVSRLDAVLKRIADLEGQQRQQHGELSAQLVDQGNQAAQKIEEQAERSKRMEETGEKLHCIEDRLGASTAEFQKIVEQMKSQLAQKLDISDFNNTWRHTIDGDLRPEIHEQRLLLEDAMHKKDQIIAMAERMQADLCCALAFKGRGPSRLGPLPGPSLTPRQLNDAGDRSRPTSSPRSQHRAHTLDPSRAATFTVCTNASMEGTPRSTSRSEVTNANSRPRSRVGFCNEP